MEVLTYVPSNVTLLLSGYQVKGWTSITVTRNSPVFKQIRGIRGKNTRTRLKDTSAVFTIETPQTELLNEVFSMVLQADAVNGTARLEVTLTEGTGTSFFTTATAYITAYPEVKYTSDISTLVWTLSCEDSQMFVGNARSAAVGLVNNGVARLKEFASGAIDGASDLINRFN